MKQRISREDDTLAAPRLYSGVETAPRRAATGEEESVEAPAPREPSCKRQVLAERYELLCLIGIGGMGNVYRARDVELDEIVAVKAIRRELSSMPGVLERFRREVRLSRRVTHPNVARVFDIGEHGGEKFLTMEYVDGESLAAILGREGPLRIDRAVEIARAVCAGLAAAHRAGVIHRDLKPDNVLIAKDGRVLLTDFGIARAIQQGDGGQTLGATLGTPAYMAPEQVEGRESIDGRADIYALGAMLYEIFTGERAWLGDGPFAVAAARLMADPPDPRRRRVDLPDAFARLVLKCMARSRDDRFATADLVAAELSSLTQPSPPRSLSVRPPPPREADASPVLSTPLGDKVVAVLPFRNQGPADDEYLADELTDDLIDTLSMRRGLKVRPRGVVARWKGVDQDPREIGRELGVQVVVGGSVRRRGGAVRINARLISVADGFQLWARHLDRAEGEVLRLNDEVAQAVAEALMTDQAAAPARDVPSDPVALDLYLRARHEYRQFWPPRLRRAIALYGEALARCPGDPMILAGDALARSRLWFFTDDGGEEAIHAAERAVAGAPDLADARLALASVRLQAGDSVAAVRELKKALALSPGFAEAHSLLGTVLLEVSAVNEGRREIEIARALDPDAPLARQSLGRALALLGRWAEADAVLGPTQPGDSTNVSGAGVRLALWSGDVERAQGLAAILATVQGRNDLSSALVHIIVHREMPPRPEFMQLEQLCRAGTRRRAFVHQLDAEIAGYLGREDEVIVAMSRSVEEGLIDLLWIERCPLLEAGRADPRYPALRAEVSRRADVILQAYREG